MWKDLFFLLIIIFLAYLSFRAIYKPIIKYLNKMRIENFQSQQIFDSAPRTLDSSEYQFADSYAKEYSPRQPDILFQRVHMLAPNVAQYGKSAPVYVHLSGSIPDTALPILNLRDPWSTSEIRAAEVPESELCEKSVTGIFNTCGMKSFNSACDFANKL